MFYKQILFAFLFFGISCAGFSQETIPELQLSLKKAVSENEMADIYYSISKVYATKLKVDSAIFFANKIKELSLAANYKKGLGKYYLALGTAFHLRRRSQESEDVTRKAIEIFSKEKDFFLLGIAYRQLAISHTLLYKSAQARKYYWTAIHYSSLAGDDNTLTREYFELASEFFVTFEIDSAATYYTKALTLSEKINDKNKIFISSGNLGILFLGTGNLPAARKYLEYSLQNRMQASDKVAVRVRLGYYAHCLILMHDFIKADSAIKEFRLMNIVLNDAWGTAYLNHLQGSFEHEKKNYQRAYDYLLAAYAMVAHMEFDFTAKNILFALGRTEFELHKYDSAIVHLKQARQFSNKVKFTLDEMEANALISQAFEKMNKADSALHYFRAYSLLKDSILSIQKQNTIIEVTTRYETEKKEQSIKMLQKEGELNSYLLQLRNELIEKQQLADEKKSQQMDLISKQNEINKLDASQKTLSLDIEKNENEKQQVKLKSLEKESSLQTTIARNQEQRKNFAYALIASIFIFSAFGYYRYRQSKKLSSQLSSSLTELKEAQTQLIESEKEKESENIRVSISRDIHDEVGATLSGVALFSEIAKQKMEQHNEPEAKIYLDHISANAKDMIEKMGDIVWTINPENDSLERIVTRLKAYAVNLCGGKGIQIHFDVNESIKDIFPAMPDRKNIYLFSKEAINNAVKYSSGSNIYFSIVEHSNKVLLEIRDDGRGFDANSIVMGNGLLNMKARAAELNAVLDVQSQHEEGTCIRLNFNFHPIGGQKKPG